MKTEIHSDRSCLSSAQRKMLFIILLAGMAITFWMLQHYNGNVQIAN
jgi:hypothetical protein